MDSSGRRVDVVLWAMLASALLLAGGRHVLGIAWVEILCVLAGSMLAVLAVWRAWGLRRSHRAAPESPAGPHQGSA